MRIGYDAKRLFHNRRGVGNYSRILIRTLGAFYPDYEYFLYTPTDPHDDLSKDFRQRPYHIKTAGKKIPWLWRTRGILKDLKRDKIDIYHGLSHELPYGIHKTGIKTVVTVHDMIAFEYPQYYTFFDRNIYQLKLKYALKNANIVHCITQSTADEVQKRFKVPVDKIVIIPPILDERFLVEKTLPKPAGLPDSYYLFVGALTMRKNLIYLVKAWAKSKSKSDLILVGNGPLYHPLKKLATSLDVENRLHILTDIDYDKLPAYYTHARAATYISEYEGFGLPLLEAAASHRPVITSSVSSMPEVLGDASIQVNPHDKKSILDGILKFEKLSDTEIKQMTDTAYNRIQQYRKDAVCDRFKNKLYRV